MHFAREMGDLTPFFEVDLDKIRPVVIGAAPVTDEVRRHLFASYQQESVDEPARQKKGRGRLFASVSPLVHDSGIILA